MKNFAQAAASTLALLNGPIMRTSDTTPMMVRHGVNEAPLLMLSPVAPVTVHDKVVDPPAATVDGEAEKLTIVGGGTTVMNTEAVVVPTALVAVSVYVVSTRALGATRPLGVTMTPPPLSMLALVKWLRPLQFRMACCPLPMVVAVAQKLPMTGSRATLAVMVMFAFTFVLVLASLNGERSRAEAPDTDRYQAYDLKYKSAAEVETVLAEMLDGVGETTQIIADEKTNRILVSGSEKAQRVAAKVSQRGQAAFTACLSRGVKTG